MHLLFHQLGDKELEERRRGRLDLPPTDRGEVYARR